MTRRARRQTNDAESVEGAAPPPQPPQEETPPPPEEKIEQNGTESEKETALLEAENCITRSRSATPKVKKVVEQNGHEDVQQEETVAREETVEADVKVAENEEDATVKGNTTDTEMDPLVVTDEPDPELVFEENSDAESGRSSPIMTRCMTRRSQTRNIPTPKTPRTEDSNETATTSMLLDREDPNATFESCDDASTKAEAGGDSTRLDYMEKETSNLEGNSFLQGAKGKSFGEAMRLLSTRRTIRPIGEDYRRRVLKTSLEEAAGGSSAVYPSRNSVERVSTVSGLKRRNCDGEEATGKRFKGDSFLARLASPLSSIRNSFSRSEMASSTPKLTGYKDEKFMLEEEGVNSQMCEVRDGERRWCSIM